LARLLAYSTGLDPVAIYKAGEEKADGEVIDGQKASAADAEVTTKTDKKADAKAKKADAKAKKVDKKKAKPKAKAKKV
jgi:hypothetical protein